MRMRAHLAAVVVTLVVSRFHCLSLDEIHSSSQTFKSLSHNNKDKTPKTAINAIRNRRQEYRIGSHSLPLQEYYKRVLVSKKEPDYQSVDAILVYNPYDSESSGESQANSLLSTELGLRLAEILGSESDVGHRVFNRINRKRKRSASNRNYYTQTNRLKAKPSEARTGHRPHGTRADRSRAERHSNLVRAKTSSVKSLVKRKSGRRVLDDHYNVEENNQNVINKSNYLKPFNSLAIPLRFKSKLNKNVENKWKRETKKSIKKRREVKSALAIEQRLDSNKENKSEEKHREVKTTDKTLVSELNDILSDDNKSSKKVEINAKTMIGQKNKTDSEVKVSKTGGTEKMAITPQKEPTLKKKAKRSDSDIEFLSPNDSDDTDSAIIYQKTDRIDNTDDNSGANDESITKQDMDEWLRREYYETIAKTLATMRKKRSGDKEDSDDIDSVETIGDNLIAIDDSDEEEDNARGSEVQNEDNVTDDTDNDYVVAAIDDDNGSNSVSTPAEGSEDGDEAEDSGDAFDWQELEEKSRPKRKRSADSYFGDLEDEFESNEINVDSERFSRISAKLESIEDSLVSEAMSLIRETAAKGSQMEAQNSQRIANRLDAAYDIEDMRTALEDLGNTFYKISNENRDYDNDNQLVHKSHRELRPTVAPINHNIIKKLEVLDDNSLELETNSDLDSDCPSLSTLSGDCSSVADLVPSARIRFAFVESCNWHQICYTCGEIYGLMASDCDAGFLEASRLSCGDSPSCEAFARLVLAPLRQSRVFYKTSIPQTCYQYQCIKDFLFDTKR